VRSVRGARHLAAITFDDGYKDNLDLALPVLQAEKLHSTFFVATRYLEDGILFDDLVVRAFAQTRESEFSESRLGLSAQMIDTNQRRRKVADSVMELLKYLPANERDVIAVDIATRLGLDDLGKEVVKLGNLVVVHGDSHTTAALKRHPDNNQTTLAGSFHGSVSGAWLLCRHYGAPFIDSFYYPKSERPQLPRKARPAIADDPRRHASRC
jgi:hypothetical protein